MEKNLAPYNQIRHLIAGTAGGLVATGKYDDRKINMNKLQSIINYFSVSLFPLELVKTRMQVIDGNRLSQYRSIYSAFRTVVQNEGRFIVNKTYSIMIVLSSFFFQ